MFNRINLMKIFYDHLQTLKYADDKKYSFPDIILFYAIPLILSIIGYFKSILLTCSQVNLLITVFSIFTGLLLNLLLLIYDIVSKNNNTTKTKFLHEIYSNISYTILLSIIIIFCLLLITFVSETALLSSIGLFLIIHFLLTILMILKRVHILLSKETEEKK